MILSHKQLTLLVAVAAIVSTLLAYVAMSLVQPDPVLASDKQIVNAIEKTIGKYDFSGNSLRSSIHKDLSAIEDAVRDMCRAQPDTTSCGF
jgi:hypothetical protein